MVEKHTQVPLGLLYLSALLKREKDVEVEVLDLSDVSIDEATLTLQRNDWDVCGFTSTTLDYCTVLDMVKSLKETLKDTAFIVGGPHASACFHDMLEDGWSAIFRGEADLSILRFVDDLTQDTISNIYNVLNNEIVQDLDWLPYPDRDALTWLGGKVLAKGNKDSINIIASRACPRSCTFCASKAIWGNKVRWRTPEAVVEEIKYCIKKYNVKIFRFSDDNMISNKKWTKRFCELVKPLDITWRMSVRVDEADYETLCLLREAGCVELGFGVESFDPKVLKILKKKITPEDSIRAVENAYRAGIGVRILMMINTPGEVYKYTVDHNIRSLEKLRSKFVYISVKPLVPFPGSDIWDNPEKFGVTIKTRDFSKYNMWMYRLGENGNKLHTEESILRIQSMTEEQQKENFNRMLGYTEMLPETQRG
jgi:radical SAM superfamily enzyme YgiQ (UPF0313 family)